MQEDCQYRWHAQGIHEFRLVRPTQDALACWLALMHEIVDEQGQLGRILVILPPDNLPPIRYGLAAVRQWMQEHPQTFNSGRTAVVYPFGKGMLAILRTFHRTLTRGRYTPVEFFHHQEYEAALDWLCQPPNPERPTVSGKPNHSQR